MCEWNPDAGRPAYTDEVHAQASWVCSFTKNGKQTSIHICDDCAGLPVFAKRKKKALHREKEGA